MKLEVLDPITNMVITIPVDDEELRYSIMESCRCTKKRATEVVVALKTASNDSRFKDKWIDFGETLMRLLPDDSSLVKSQHMMLS